MDKIKERNEIKDEFKWDLTPIFKNIDEFNKEYDEVSKLIKKYDNYKGKITSSKDNFKEFLNFDEKAERRLLKLYYYAHLNFDSETTNNEYQILKGKIDDLLQLNSVMKSFVNIELLNTDYEIIKDYLKDEKLKKYSFNMEQLFRYKPHKLTMEEENVLANFSNVLSSPEEIYESLTDSDLKFGTIKVDGKEVEFNESNWAIYSRHKDRKVRQDAFNMLYNTYSNFKNTISNTYNKNIDYYINNAKIRKYNSSLEASLFDDNVNVSVYNNLIDTINKHLNINHKYYELKQKELKLDELHLYDVYVPLIEEKFKSYTFNEAKDLVIKSLSILGDDYIKIINKAFDEKWIDIYNNKGKRGGAYSSGFYDINPYLLLNFEGTFEDVSTLAHELGHSVHSYLSWNNNDYVNSNYEIFVAEVASTVNELLLRMYLLNNSNNKEEKLFIINSMLELYRTTIYRQTMFAEFEKDTHALKEQGNVLTNESLSDLYYKLNKKYFGNNVVVDDLIKYEWMRIPHLYYDFYVYKYVIGLSCATYIVENIMNKKDGYIDKYLDFLKSGGSDYPANELKLAGIDITKPDVIESALKMFDNLIDEYKKVKGSD